MPERVKTCGEEDQRKGKRKEHREGTDRESRRKMLKETSHVKRVKKDRHKWEDKGRKRKLLRETQEEELDDGFQAERTRCDSQRTPKSDGRVILNDYWSLRK